jgi:putative transposase
MAYTLANPVKARLVDRATDWEGASSVDMVFGRARRISRPKKFFRKSMPDEVELVLTRPKGFRDLSDAEVRELVREDVARREAEHAREGRAMGMKRVRAQDWRSSPETVEEPGQLRPTVAGSKWAKVEALRRSKDWLRAYYGALADFVAGRRDVEFPPGTWQMCARLRCRIAGAAPQ